MQLYVVYNYLRRILLQGSALRCFLSPKLSSRLPSKGVYCRTIFHHPVWRLRTSGSLSPFLPVVLRRLQRKTFFLSYTQIRESLKDP
jgi:hypothetical protein